MSSAAPQPQRIPCPHCQASIKAPSLPPGSKVACPRCNQPFTLGQSTTTEPAPAPVAPPALPSAAANRTTKPTAPAVAPPTQTTRAPAPPPTTAPAPRPAARPKQPDTVDPMQQPIVRAGRLEPQPTEHREFGISCKLCGTRLYALPEQIGQQIKCPDCHSAVDVVAPRGKSLSKGPTLDEVDDIPMSNPVERPRYKPMVEPRGEDAILGLLNDPPFDVAGNRPPSARAKAGATPAFPPVGQPPQAAGSAVARSQSAPQYHDQDEDDDLELRLSDPVERPEIKVELPHHLAADLPDPRDEGSYGDELWGGGPDDGRPKWQKSPFLVGVFEFLFQPSSLGSWIGHSLAAGTLLCLLQTAMYFSQQSDLQQILGLLLSIGFTVAALTWGAAFSAGCLAVVQDTANGNESVEDWPDWHIFDWFVRAFTLGAAAFVAAFPGMLIGSAILTAGGPIIAVPLPVLASLVAFFPIVITSILVEGSVLSIVSSTVLRMVQVAADGWILFYMLTFVIGMLAMGTLALLELQNYIASFVAGILGVTLALLYMRLLGRLMWYSQHKVAEADLREENRRRWAERAMHT